MDTVLLIVGATLCIVGWLGSFLPVLPGAWLCTLGLICLKYTSYGMGITTNFILILIGISLLVNVLANVIPAYIAKKAGGSRWGQIGVLAGTIIGLFFGVMGVIFGPMIGALVGELIHDGQNAGRAVKSAWYAFIGFVLGTGLSLVWATMQCYWFIQQCMFTYK